MLDRLSAAAARERLSLAGRQVTRFVQEKDDPNFV
jgi:hypothetical protein